MNLNYNNLINRFQQHQQNNRSFQNNSLLQNNPLFRNNLPNNRPNNNLTQQQQKMLMYMAKMEQQKKIQQIKQMERLNKMLEGMDNKKLRELVIQPEIVKKKTNDIIPKWKKEKSERIPTRNKYWKNRTNIPYKCIIKDKKHTDKFINIKRKIKKEDLIVHRVTLADKNKKIVERDLKKLENSLEKHNKELKVIYSASKEASHIEKFKYNHVSKHRIKYNPSEHSKLKKDKIERYKREQKKLEAGKNKIDQVFNFLVNDGFINKNKFVKSKPSVISGNKSRTPVRRQTNNKNKKFQTAPITQKTLLNTKTNQITRSLRTNNTLKSTRTNNRSMNKKIPTTHNATNRVRGKTKGTPIVITRSSNSVRFTPRNNRSKNRCVKNSCIKNKCSVSEKTSACKPKKTKRNIKNRKITSTTSNITNYNMHITIYIY